MDPQNLSYMTPEIVCYLPRGESVPTDTLTIDYDLVRLTNSGARRTECTELSEVEGKFSCILIHALSHQSTDQYKRDFSAAARLLETDGHIRVRIHNVRTLRHIERTLKPYFRELVRTEISSGLGRLPELIGCGPIPHDLDKPEAHLVLTDGQSKREYIFTTRAGLFSSGHIDPGTRLLIKTTGDFKGASVLDVGCGIGPIGIVMAGRGANVTMIDSDARAVALSRKNLAANGLSGAVLLADGMAGISDNSIDFVLSNPPTHSGSDILRQLFKDSARVIRSSGTARFVVREQLNYEKWMSELGRVAVLSTADGYKVLELASDSVTRPTKN